MTPLQPGDTIGILGGGQLGRMLCLAAANLGLKTIVLDPEEGPPAAQVTNRHIKAQYTDEEALRTLSAAADVITFEFENVPGATVTVLSSNCTVHPPGRALKVSQDRIEEKQFFNKLGIKTANWLAITNADELSAAQAFSFPAVLKTARLGYDGKGQTIVKAGDELKIAWDQLGAVPCVLEAFVSFDGEASIVAARSHDSFKPYPFTENIHEDHILSVSRVPARWNSAIEAEAIEIAQKTAEALSYVGVFAIEFFVSKTGLLVNEMAPRVHNSGHWTIDGATTSQFENHIRAIAGWPLGSPDRTGDVEMKNLIGKQTEAWVDLLKDPAAKLHLYGKAEARPGRKMGHITRVYPFGTFKPEKT